MSNEGEHAAAPSYTAIWFYLLALTAIEVALAYVQPFSTGSMLLLLMALSVVKAALIVAYFMHLRFEKMSLIVSLIPVLAVVICLLGMFFPDSYRLFDLRVR